MLKSPPGIRFLITRIPQLLLPAICFYGAFIACDFFAGTWQLSTWSKILLSLLMPIVLSTVGVWHQDLKRLKEARALGAQLPPRYKVSKIAGLDVIQSLEHQLKSGYIGEPSIAYLMNVA